MIWLFGITGVACIVPYGIIGQRNVKEDESQFLEIDRGKPTSGEFGLYK